MLIEVHIIQNHAPSNLNRDDSGSPKSAIFGGYRRARISSQCLKRCYRTSKTFRNEVDGLGMHTRSMPEEIKARLLTHAKTLPIPEKKELKAKYEDWAEKCQAKLAAILGKGSKEAKAEDGDDEDQANESETETAPADAGNEEAEGTDGERSEKANRLKTAQSIFWREMEVRALFDAYRERIEWDRDVPDVMRAAFDNKGKVKPKDMIKTFDQIPKGKLGDAINLIKQRHSQEIGRLEAKCLAPASEADAKKKDREKKLKDAKNKNDEIAANALMQLIPERFDLKVILKEAGLRPDGIPVDMALFGRMVASPLMHNIEASSQFAHAISTHEFAREFDLWTRVDDRRDKRLDFYEAFGAGEKLESGTDGMGDVEFTSACYYSYFNVDFSALVDNLTGKALKHDLDDSNDREEATRRACNAVIGLVKAAIFERPTGKFNSMATPSLPSIVLVEVRDSHVPVSYADAFAKPVDPKNEEKLSETGQVQRVDLPKESAKRLILDANRITKAFNRTAKARLLFSGGADIGVGLNGKDTKANNETVAASTDNATNCGEIPFTPVDDVEALVHELRTVLECPKEQKDD
jgi:CT1975-like protein